MSTDNSEDQSVEAWNTSKDVFQEVRSEWSLGQGQETLCLLYRDQMGCKLGISKAEFRARWAQYGVFRDAASVTMRQNHGTWRETVEKRVEKHEFQSKTDVAHPVYLTWRTFTFLQLLKTTLDARHDEIEHISIRSPCCFPC